MQYSLKVIFISLLVRPAFFAALGKFHFAANNISIDCRVSDLILVTFKNFFVKPYRVNFCRDFFCAFFGIKSHFSSERVRIRKSIFIKIISTEFQHCHELFYGFTIHDTLFSLIGIQKELTLHGINDTAGQVLVLHWICFLPAYYRAIRARCQPLYWEIDDAFPTRESMPPWKSTMFLVLFPASSYHTSNSSRCLDSLRVLIPALVFV